MKVTTIIDPACEEEVIIRAQSHSKLVDKIEELIAGETAELMGFLGESIVVLDYVKVQYFTVENDKTYARCGGESYRVKRRLYEMERLAPACFVKINQSCLANTRQIARFETSFSGALRVVFKNGDTDYVSRRCLKNVKERFGI